MVDRRARDTVCTLFSDSLTFTEKQSKWNKGATGTIIMYHRNIHLNASEGVYQESTSELRQKPHVILGVTTAMAKRDIILLSMVVDELKECFNIRSTDYPEEGIDFF